MSVKLRVVALKAGMPTVMEARARLKTELNTAKNRGTKVLKLIHGYGSSGVGGSLKDAIHKSLHRRKKEGKIRSYVAGEKWDIFEDSVREILEECPELARDRDLNKYNEGITIVLL